MIKVFDTEHALALAVAKEMEEQLDKKRRPVFCLAAGSTASKCYKRFAEDCCRSKAIKKLNFVSLDEWIGISGNTVGSCYQMLQEDLFQHLPLSSKQITFFDTVNNNPEEECCRIDAFIHKNPITFSVMGVGMNGHIGLNEPGSPVLNHSRVVLLSDTTKRVSSKYFKEPIHVEKGITLGLQQIIDSERVIVAVTGPHKKEIVREIIEKPQAGLPAQKLLGYEHIDFYFDKEAAQNLDRSFTDEG